MHRHVHVCTQHVLLLVSGLECVCTHLQEVLSCRTRYACSSVWKTENTYPYMKVILRVKGVLRLGILNLEGLRLVIKGSCGVLVRYGSFKARCQWGALERALRSPPQARAARPQWTVSR
jgi:hypothetical protein